MKRHIRLTEGDLHRIVKESVSKVLKEGYNDPDWENYYSHEEDGMNQVAKLLLQAQRIIEPLKDSNDRYIALSQFIGHWLMELKKLADGWYDKR